jgi:phosphatidylserine decarboxylase
MNTLDIAKAITDKDIEKAKLMHFSYKMDLVIDGLKYSVDRICKDKNISSDILDTVFAITYMRIKDDN